MSFLGRGWAFPPEFDIEVRTVEMVDTIDDIRQSLHILFSTALGERVMRPEFGCNLEVFQFEPMNNAFLAYLKDMITKAILLHEPRIRLDEIKVESEQLEGRLLIEVIYVVRTTNTRNNFVYNFYLREI